MSTSMNETSGSTKTSLRILFVDCLCKIQCFLLALRLHAKSHCTMTLFTTSLVDSGKAVPFLYPWAGFGAFLVLGYLLIDHRQSPTLKWFRFPIFAFLFAFQSWVILTNRARHPAGAFGIGLLSAWGILWVARVLVINDCQTDFVRIERARSVGTGNHVDHSLKNRIPNGSLPSTASTPEGSGARPESKQQGALYWQTYPTSFADRIDWVADVFCSFRGVGWNWQTTTVPPLPKSVASQLHGAVDSADTDQVATSKIGIRRFSDRESLLKPTLANVIIGYLVLDVIKTLMSHDGYFWGYMDALPPWYLPDTLQKSHVFVKSYRLLISLTGVYTALWQIFKLGPLFFSGILGPKLIGVRGEPWMNPPDMFGSFRNILDNGIAGWWGGWWHQVFRAAFEAHALCLLKALGIEKRSESGKLISLFVAFSLSGCLHASGSYTLLGDTRPFLGPMRFFMLQPLAIILQMFLAQQLSKFGILQKTPKWLRQGANFVFVHTWLYFTAPLLVDDFARGGVWLFQPVAISPLRGLGLGARDDTWWCWWDGILFWRSGKHWWDTGIAL